MFGEEVSRVLSPVALSQNVKGSFHRGVACLCKDGCALSDFMVEHTQTRLQLGLYLEGVPAPLGSPTGQQLNDRQTIVQTIV